MILHFVEMWKFEKLLDSLLIYHTLLFQFYVPFFSKTHVHISEVFLLELKIQVSDSGRF